jgi:hypothetical protein
VAGGKSTTWRGSGESGFRAVEKLGSAALLLFALVAIDAGLQQPRKASAPEGGMGYIFHELLEPVKKEWAE